STAADNQSSVEIVVLQGERPLARDNKTLGKFMLDGLPPAPRGVPQVEVTFDIDANGIINVHAKDRATGKEQKVTVTGATTLDKSEVDKMVKEAESHAAEDARKREEIEAHNQLDGLVYQVEKFLRESGDKVAPDARAEVEGKLPAAKTALEGGDLTGMREAFKDLSESFQKVGAAMYSQAPEAEPAGAAAGATGGSQSGDGDVVDAEFKEV
ncbi:MAG TPA: Hsp70 family protein, partial [Candidatus Dormibacteraeota bacterium]|nr:Hsp70 family protein [Candidatus Dormibacteraeota bacterium]